MVTKCDDDQPTDRVNIEQSASRRLEGRVLQKKRNDKRRNYICDVRTVSHSYNVLEVNLLGVFCLIWSCIYLPGVCPNKLGVMASHSPSNTAKNFKYKYIWYWQIHLVIQIHLVLQIMKHMKWRKKTILDALASPESTEASHSVSCNFAKITMQSCKSSQSIIQHNTNFDSTKN